MTSADLTPRVLREYALVADGERGALIGPDGEVAWLCVPRWDSPAAFSGLLGGPGRFSVTPADPWHVWGGYYEDGTLIWRSRWVGQSRIECREALAMPADPHRAVLLRRIEALDGPARVTVTLDVRGGYGRRMTGLSRAGGAWTGRSGATWLRWSGATRARPAGGALAMTVVLDAGQSHDLVLELSDRELPGLPPDPDQAWAATQEAWSQVVPDCSGLIAVTDARHAYAVLRGLTAGSGAMVAAATTSLPERLEAGRDYDYRFRHDARPLHQAEGAFLLCGFWMALLEHQYGNPVAAAHWFERNRSACGPAALYTEEFDVHQRQLRGNLPQAFVHAAMLECAVRLSPDVALGGDAPAI
jgi:GH15 family glucan-1,4-alpha-glucosidase